MLHDLSITCLDRFLGRTFVDNNGDAWIDTFSTACSFPGSFRPCAGLQGVNYGPWPGYHLFGRFWAEFVRTRMGMLG